MCLALLAAAAVLFILPETAGTQLPQTVADVEGTVSKHGIKTPIETNDTELHPLTES